MLQIKNVPISVIMFNTVINQNKNFEFGKLALFLTQNLWCF